MKHPFLISYSKGFLPGPIETEDEFFNRISLTEKILENPSESITEKSFQKSILVPFNGATLLATGSSSLFFHASSTTILEISKGVFLPIIKSPSRFSSYFVEKEEVMRHEAVHAKRAQFEEPCFEEIIAYRTSNSLLRKMISPIISTNKDSLLFFLSICLVPISLLPLLFVTSFLSIRLFIRQKKISRCLIHLSKFINNPEEVLIAMTDKEIYAMSKNKLDLIDFTLFRWKYLLNLFGRAK